MIQGPHSKDEEITAQKGTTSVSEALGSREDSPTCIARQPAPCSSLCNQLPLHRALKLNSFDGSSTKEVTVWAWEMFPPFSTSVFPLGDWPWNM